MENHCVLRAYSLKIELQATAWMVRAYQATLAQTDSYKKSNLIAIFINSWWLKYNIRDFLGGGEPNLLRLWGKRIEIVVLKVVGESARPCGFADFAFGHFKSDYAKFTWTTLNSGFAHFFRLCSSSRFADSRDGWILHFLNTCTDSAKDRPLKSSFWNSSDSAILDARVNKKNLCPLFLGISSRRLWIPVDRFWCDLPCSTFPPNLCEALSICCAIKFLWYDWLAKSFQSAYYSSIEKGCSAIPLTCKWILRSNFAIKSTEFWDCGFWLLPSIKIQWWGDWLTPHSRSQGDWLTPA